MIPGRAWEDYLQLAVTEVRDYGAGSVQVCRQLRALLEALLAVAPPARRPAVEEELRRLAVVVEATFSDPERRALAGTADRQGIGGRVSRHAVADVPASLAPPDPVRSTSRPGHADGHRGR